MCQIAGGTNKTYVFGNFFPNQSYLDFERGEKRFIVFTMLFLFYQIIVFFEKIKWFIQTKQLLKSWYRVGRKVPNSFEAAIEFFD